MINRITILSSGIGLGVYVPGLIIKKKLERKGYLVHFEVFENLIIEEKKNKLIEKKHQFQKNFKFALMAQRLTKDITPSIDENKAMQSILKWRDDERRIFIILSGFWLPVMSKYLSLAQLQNPIIHLCHVGSNVNISWKFNDFESSHFEHIWFWQYEGEKINYYLDISDEKPIPFEKRTERCVIHGGGWGIGTYQEKIPILENANVMLDIIVNSTADINEFKTNNRYFMLRSDWVPWHKNNEECEFSPFLQINNNKEIIYHSNYEYPKVYDLIKDSRAIISKSGGGNLIDSFSSATPIVFLEPYGEYENKNAELWIKLGFGISFEDWEKNNFSFQLLEGLHHNLNERRLKTKNYINEFLQKLKQYKNATDNFSEI